MLNPYRAFLDLLPQHPLQLGTVQSATSTACTVETPDGGTVALRGTAAVGSKVFFRDGVVESAAPSLPVVLIDV